MDDTRRTAGVPHALAGIDAVPVEAEVVGQTKTPKGQIKLRLPLSVHPREEDHGEQGQRRSPAERRQRPKT
jgi:hypothetical protein